MRHNLCIVTIVVIVTVPSWFLGLSADAKQDYPDVRLRVTVQQSEGAGINPAFHVQDLRCSRDECSLTSITLNSCRYFPVSRGMASPVIFERSSTKDGALKVVQEGDTLISIETGSDIGGEYVTTQRFQYERPRDGGPITKLVGYSGGFAKNSSIAKQVITIQYVPFKTMYKEIQLDCPIALPGIHLSE